MGVHGLTTYLREHQSTLSITLQLPLLNLPHTNGRNADGEGQIPVVVDGWSFIFEVVHCADLPWVYGGEYTQLSQLVRQVVHAWIKVGLDLHFVFDGPYPTLKFPTLISRHTQNQVQNALLFFRTSATARAAPRFLRETAMLPPLSYGVCVDTLVELAAGMHKNRLHVHIADEEGDPYAVALAGRLNAYVAGRDSDFVVLNTEGYQGYIPLDEMVWTAANAADGDGSVYSLDTEPDVDDGGFKPARSGKARKKRAVADQQAGRGIIPPDDTQGLALSLTVYSPATLAAHLDIPASLLPLLGALVGNDFTGSSDDAGAAGPRRANLQRLFFERQLTLGQRIARTASTLSGLLAAAFGQPAPGVQKKRTKKPIGSVMELIDAAVGALLLRPLDTFGPGEREAVVERVVEATLQYAIPRPPDEEEAGEGWVSEVCALHVAEVCPLFVSLSRLVVPPPGDVTPEDVPLGKKVMGEDAHAAVRAAYVTAYRRGQMNPHVLDAVQSATAWPWLFLEDPDKECVERSVGRPIREWMYAVLDASVGLPSPPVPEGEEADGEEDEDDDEDELIDVVEEDDDVDPLARLRGALKELDSDDEDGESADDSPPPSVPSTPAISQPKIITEYVRRGTRVAPEEVAVPPLPELLRTLALESPVHPRTRLPLPPPLWPGDTRRRLLLGALGSDGPAVAALPDDRVLGVAALRFVVRRMHVRALEAPGVKERQQERWTRAEARAFLACVRPEGRVEAEGEQQVPILERHVQLVAQIGAALGAAERFAQVLLLAPGIASPARYFSGARFHALLSGDGALEAEVEEGVWAACVEGLEDAFAALPQRKSKKEKRRKGVVQAPPLARGASKGKSMFELLADADA